MKKIYFDKQINFRGNDAIKLLIAAAAEKRNLDMSRFMREVLKKEAQAVLQNS